MLHLIFQSPIETATLERIDLGDTAIFLENAVLWVLKNNAISNILTRKLSSNHLYVLSDDIAVRGIDPNELIEGLEIIDYAGLVELTISNLVTQSWT